MNTNWVTVHAFQCGNEIVVLYTLNRILIFKIQKEIIWEIVKSQKLNKQVSCIVAIEILMSSHYSQGQFSHPQCSYLLLSYTPFYHTWITWLSRTPKIK